MGIPIDDEPLEPTDEARAGPVSRPPEKVTYGEVSPGDSADQMHEVSPGWTIGRRSSDPEVAEGDAIDQAMSVPVEDADI